MGGVGDVGPTIPMRLHVTALFLRDLRLGIRAGGGALTGALFFLAVIATIPFAVGPDLNLLARIGPAILWIGALLASLLGLDRLFQADREDGSLDLLILGADRHMLALTVWSNAWRTGPPACCLWWSPRLCSACS